MGNPAVRYMFSGRFDTGYLAELYADDTEIAIEMFTSSIWHISLEMKNAVENYRSGDLEGVRKVFHKIKPMFGYVGLPSLQEHVQQFEKKCLMVEDVESIRKEYEELSSLIGETIQMLQQELNNMHSFTNSRAS